VDHGNTTTMNDILPDSRLQDTKGTVRGQWNKLSSLNWVPVFCANCGIPYGYVPEENCTFACWLCDQCAEKWGLEYGLALMPDEVFWERVKLEQLERYARLLSPEELQVVAESTWNSLSTLLRESPMK